jgi:hypothetical protein
MIYIIINIKDLVITVFLEYIPHVYTHLDLLLTQTFTGNLNIITEDIDTDGNMGGDMAITNSPSVSIPLIRRINPILIAQSIISVQPMQIYDGNGIDIKVYGDMITIEPIRFIDDEMIKLFEEIDDYITNTFGDRVIKNELDYIFTQEKDKTMFLLKWAK